MKNIRHERDHILDIIENDLLTVHFQPVCSVNGEVFGYEALSRFKHGTGYQSAAKLFEAAIRTETISSLDMYCSENAIREASNGFMRQENARLFINICPETLLSPTHMAGITDEFADCWGIPKKKIILEITEETAVRNYSLFNEAVSYYRDKGYRIALDDFGTGYGGLKMLSIIRPDFVKIDSHFIQQIDKNFVSLAVVDAITVLCHRLGMKVIAEGIEKRDEFIFAIGLGIELFQGYFIGMPAPAPAGSVKGNSLRKDAGSGAPQHL
ncbi:MAG: EAL domain-containing protein [Actinomycetota bacterium]|nr:EAL domain-containing protein [Actinomycetota bacterium]